MSSQVKDRILFIASFLPIVILMVVGYAVPVFSNVTRSLQGYEGEFVGIENYIKVLSSYYFLDSLAFTLKVALVSTALAMAIAIIVAMALRETFAGKRLTVLAFQLNMTIPRMAAAMMLMLLLSQTGWLSQLSHSLGLTQGAGDFPWFVRDNSGLGLIIAFTWKFFPYIGMSVMGILQGASREYEDQAAVLGVGPFRRFWHVTLPLIVPATSVAAIIVFASAFGDYEIPAILGGSEHRVLSIYTYLKYADPIMKDHTEAYVLMVFMSAVLAAVILIYRKLTMAEGESR